MSGRLALLRKKRDRALTHLGLLGWQQADFDERTQGQVDEIHNVERVQSRLMNQSAEFAAEIRRLIGERDAARRAYSETRKQLDTEARKAVEKRSDIERQLSATRKREPNFERRIPELDRELRELNKVYSELLLIDRHTAKTRQELVRIRERIVSIPNEKSDLRTQHLRIVSEMRRLEEALRPISENATAAEQALRKAVSDWELREASLQAEIKSKEREKAAVERHFAMLEAAKINPYLRIGEVLAGSGIAPLNQPESLANVRRLQVQVALLEGAIVDSRAASQAADGRELRASMVLCISIACVVLLILAIALAHG